MKTSLYKTFFGCLMLLSIGFQVQSQTFYAIILADTQDSSIGRTSQHDLSSMAKQFETIAKMIGYKTQLIVMSDEKFNSKGLNQALEQVNCSSQDIVFFYYSAHGYSPKENNNSLFPYLYLKDDNHYSLENTHQLLIQKRPRLCITLGDCCNNLISNVLLNHTQPITRGITTDQYNKLLSMLFVNCQGDILISSAQKGQKALADKELGGHYTFSWLEALQQAVNNNKTIDWRQLLMDADLRLQQLQKNFEASQKHSAIWEVRVSTNSDEPPVTPPVDPVKPVANFLEMNTFLNSLIDSNITYMKRDFIREQKTPIFFTPEANVAIYIKSPDRPVEIKSIKEYLKTLLVSPNIKGFNFVERLSSTNQEGKYHSITVQEIR